MTADFSLNLLRYLVQVPDGSQYAPYLSGEIFDFVTHKIAFDILSGYYKQYGRYPTAVVAQQILQDEVSKLREVPSGLQEELNSLFEQLSDPLSDRDLKFLKETLVESIKSRKTDQFILDYGEGKLTLEQLTSKLGQMSYLDKAGQIEDLHGFLIQDRRYHIDDQIEGVPTFLEDLNKMTAAHGFYSPQLVVIMSGPKHFKTGLMIKMAVEFARNGNNVYYADAENSLRSIRNRAKQCMMECTYSELYDLDVAEEMDILMDNFYKYRNGDIFVDFFPAGTATVNDVKNKIGRIFDETGWLPNIIFWDNIDHFLPSNPADQRKDTRFQIQKVYFEVIALNNAIGSFSIAPTQVNRKAISKKTFDITDLAEDFGKAANAHAIFAICGTSDEVEMGIRRIIPAAQREGQKYSSNTQCIVKIDEERMKIDEVDKEEFLKDVTDD